MLVKRTGVSTGIHEGTPLATKALPGDRTKVHGVRDGEGRRERIATNQSQQKI